MASSSVPLLWTPTSPTRRTTDCAPLIGGDRPQLIVACTHSRGAQASHYRGQGDRQPGLRVLLDSLAHLPAVVFNSRLDVLAANALARAFYAPVFDTDETPNTALFMFLDEYRAQQLFPQWEQLAGDTVSILRIEAGRRPDDPALLRLIGALSTRSGAFRTRWAANDVRAHKPGTKVFRHPLIDEVTLPFENLTVDATGDQFLTVFTPPAGDSGARRHSAVGQLDRRLHAVRARRPRLRGRRRAELGPPAPPRQ